MDHERIYEYRFRNVDPAKRQVVWQEIARFMHERMGRPERMLDPAAGMCEFINHVPSKERWAVDLNEAFLRKHADPAVKLVAGDALTAELPKDHFDGVFVSNFLEHLHSQDQVADFLGKMHGHLRKGGRIAVMGPNFKHIYREYFDFADHTVALSESGAAEHLYGAGFTLESVTGKFLPYSFKGRLPAGRALVKMYLNTPLAWRVLGRQFLLIARK